MPPMATRGPPASGGLSGDVRSWGDEPGHGPGNGGMDSSPIVAITGQVFARFLGKDAFQETDITGITLPITKHNYLVTDVEDLVRRSKKPSTSPATAGPGPVLIDIPGNVQQAVDGI